jgi:hypothetical protein
MSGELEAAGAMATAGLVAGAIEGREGQAGEGACLNCGAKLEGAYCSQCGQAARPHRSLVHVFEEFLHGILHFDTKAWRTLPMVLFRPGTLTRNYVYGKRARYISPLALFLFTIFFMFAVFAFAGSGPPVNISESGSVADAQEELAEAREELATAQRELDGVIANPDPDQPAGLEESLARQAVGLAQAAVAREEAAVRRAVAREEAARVAAAQDQAVAADGAPPSEPAPPAAEPAPSAPDVSAPPERPGVTVDESGVTVDRNNDSLTWRDVSREMAEDEDFVVIQGWDSFNEKAREKLRNPDLAVYKIQQAAYKFSFLLVPISLPFIALLFLWKRGVTLYDHVVFALYSLCFASILFVIIALSARWEWANSLAGMLLVFGIPVHTYFHLKGAYALGWFSALWRTSFMLLFALISLIIFLITIVIVGLTG